MVKRYESDALPRGDSHEQQGQKDGGGLRGLTKLRRNPSDYASGSGLATVRAISWPWAISRVCPSGSDRKAQ